MMSGASILLGTQIGKLSRRRRLVDQHTYDVHDCINVSVGQTRRLVSNQQSERLAGVMWRAQVGLNW